MARRATRVACVRAVYGFKVVKNKVVHREVINVRLDSAEVHLACGVFETPHDNLAVLHVKREGLE